MESVPTELFYVLMILAILLFQYLMKRFGPQAPKDAAHDERLSQIPEDEDLEATQIASTGSAMAGGSFGRSDAPSLAPARRHFPRKAQLGTRRELQDAMVVATIMGPCRYFEPHDVRR